MSGYENLKVWQKGIELANQIEDIGKMLNGLRKSLTSDKELGTRN